MGGEESKQIGERQACVCVCVCEKEREQNEKKKKRDKDSDHVIIFYCLITKNTNLKNTVI